MIQKNTIQLILLVILPTFLILSACSERDVDLNRGFENQDMMMRNTNLRDARHGHKDSQYIVGKSYCCGFDDMHNTKRAIEWLCQSAKQNYAPAQHLLGEIYTNNIDGFAPGWSVHTSRELDKLGYRGNEHLILGYMWYMLAANWDYENAQEMARDMENELTYADVEKAHNYFQDWQNAPCTWNEVFVPPVRGYTEDNFKHLEVE